MANRHDRSDTPNRLNLSAGVASVCVAFFLVVLKVWAMAATQSLSVAASLADSAMDLMISLAGLAAIVYAARPPDEDHTFGHTSAEDLAALGQSLFILASSAVIFWAAIERLFSDAPQALNAQGAGMVAMAVSIVVTVALVIWQRRVAARTGNKVVAADSLHYLGDLLPNIGAILALWASAAFGFQKLDSVVAIGAALMLATGAINIFRTAWHALMDRSADPEIIKGIEEIAGNWPGIHGFHDMQSRTAGSRVFVNMHIELDGTQTLREAHDIGAAMKRAVLERFPQVDLIVHKDPTRD